MYIGFALLTVSMLLYVAAIGWGLPGLLLRTKYRSVQLHARGLRRCLYNGKRCVVYERSMNWRRYITRYLICQGEGCKYLKCKVSPSVRALEYDVVLFDRYNCIFDVINVKETLNSPYTSFLRLPDATSYVSLQLRRVNKTQLSNEKQLAYIPRLRIVWFVVLAFLMTLVEAVAIMASCAHAFGGVFREDFVSSIERMLIGVGVACVVALIGLLIVAISYRRHSRT